MTEICSSLSAVLCLACPVGGYGFICQEHPADTTSVVTMLLLTLWWGGLEIFRSIAFLFIRRWSAYIFISLFRSDEIGTTFEYTEYLQEFSYPGQAFRTSQNVPNFTMPDNRLVSAFYRTVSVLKLRFLYLLIS